MPTAILPPAVRLQPQELVLATARQYLPARCWPLIGTIIVFLLPFFWLVALVSWRPWGWLLLGALFGVGLWWPTRWWIRWAKTRLVVTNQRVIDIDQRGIWDRVVSEAPLDRISDVHFSQRGLAGTLWHYGTVEYLILPGQTRIVSGQLKHPQIIAQKILTAMTATEPAGADETADWTAVTVASANDLLRLLERMRQQLGPAQFSRLVGKVDPGYWQYRIQRAKQRREQSGDGPPAA
ncbi:MAG: PH domain-containing protein [Patescibacteria group bacterium]